MEGWRGSLFNFFASAIKNALILFVSSCGLTGFCPVGKENEKQNLSAILSPLSSLLSPLSSLLSPF